MQLSSTCCHMVFFSLAATVHQPKAVAVDCFAKKFSNKTIHAIHGSCSSHPELIVLQVPNGFKRKSLECDLVWFLLQLGGLTMKIFNIVIFHCCRCCFYIHSCTNSKHSRQSSRRNKLNSSRSSRRVTLTHTPQTAVGSIVFYCVSLLERMDAWVTGRLSLRKSKNKKRCFLFMSLWNRIFACFMDWSAVLIT